MIKKVNITQEGVESPSFTSVEDQYAYAHRLAELAENSSEDSTIDAKVLIPECAPSDRQKVNNRFGDVIQVDENCIQFEDPEVRRILVESTNPRIDTNGDGKISVAEAEAATSLPSFQYNTKIESFEELGMFKNAKVIPNFAFMHCSNLQSIDLSNIESLRSHSFSYSNIEEVNLPNLKDIGLWEWNGYLLSSSAFYKSGIKKIISLGSIERLGSNLYSWGDTNITSPPPYAEFAECDKLQSVNLPSTCKYLGYRVFYACPCLETINLESVSYFGKELFRGTEQLSIDAASLYNAENVASFAFFKTKLYGVLDMPNLKSMPAESVYSWILATAQFAFTDITGIASLGEITELPEFAEQGHYGYYYSCGIFDSCEKLEYAVLPSTLTMFGKWTFYNCTSLATLVVKAIVPPTFGTQPLYNCPLSDGIYVSDSSIDTYKTADGWSAYADKIKPISGWEGVIEDCVRLYPSLADQVESNAKLAARFVCNSEYANTIIERDAIGFADEEVERVLLASSVTNPTGDTVITRSVAESVTSIPSFKDNTEIKSFDELDKFKNVTTLVYPQLSNVPNLASVDLSNIHVINCGLIRLDHLQGDLNLGNLETIFTNSDNYNEYGVLSNTEVDKISDLGLLQVIPDGWRNITYHKSGCFSNNRLLKKVVLPSTLKTIGVSAFNRCEQLEEINLGNVEEIKRGAFYSCTSLNNLDLHSIQYIDTNAFGNVPSLSGDLSMPSLIELRGEYDENWNNYGSFSNSCITSITDIGRATRIPDGHTNTGYPNSGFCSNCKQLEKVILPDTFSYLGRIAFIGCTSLHTLVCKAIIPPTFGNGALHNCPISILYVPDASVEDYKAADGWSAYADKIKPISEWEDVIDEAKHLYPEYNDYFDNNPVIASHFVCYPKLGELVSEYPNLKDLIVEWPDVVYSVVDSTKTNFLIKRNTSGYIQTDIQPDSTNGADIETLFVKVSDIDGAHFGGLRSGRFYTGVYQYGVFQFAYGEGYRSSIGVDELNKAVKIHTHLQRNNSYMEINDEMAVSASVNMDFVTTEKLPLFAYNEGNITTSRGGWGMGYYKYTDGIQHRYYAPFIRDGVSGYIELVTGEFLTSAVSSGIFEVVSINRNV